ncbi:ABC transporter ATP-binding protein [Brachybacterium sp. J153]|uniref:ABC transporter ATP-binding protein n=1 Tax=Brachybacterium sp. J153 TaxID=3116488 RepID=UPI002E782131|nr:ABC transporter ATP-binding protein [Brachybacterium sp. J153]MEE1619391.1 ABC transporter ATP-binding protein [Brachybacterium sp. J153]
MTALQTHDLTKRFRDVLAADRITLSLEQDRIHGLLGRNGAGKTTLMKLVTGQLFASSGRIRLLGEDPLENVAVLSRTCFIQESQSYPDGFRPLDLLRIARDLHPAWDEALARELVADFRLPEKRPIKKLSRGQLSAVGIIVGLASRAPLTFFDEPYLGLDAVARRLFYDRLLADYAEHPRTVVLSTHHIDEVANLLEHVVVLDQGRVVIDDDVDTLRAASLQVSGRAGDVADFVAGAEVLRLDELGALATATLHRDALHDEEGARRRGLDVTPVSLQDYIVHRTAA